MQIRTKNCRVSNFKNGITQVNNFWISNCFYLHIVCSMPANCFHNYLVLNYGFQLVNIKINTQFILILRRNNYHISVTTQILFNNLRVKNLDSKFATSLASLSQFFARRILVITFFLSSQWLNCFFDVLFCRLKKLFCSSRSFFIQI